MGVIWRFLHKYFVIGCGWMAWRQNSCLRAERVYGLSLCGMWRVSDNQDILSGLPGIKLANQASLNNVSVCVWICVEWIKKNTKVLFPGKHLKQNFFFLFIFENKQHPPLCLSALVMSDQVRHRGHPLSPTTTPRSGELHLLVNSNTYSYSYTPAYLPD